METHSLKTFYSESLGIAAPWKVVDVEILKELRQVRVQVTCAPGVAWVDPETRGRAHIKDWTVKEWRHLDTCQYQTVIIARVPRIQLKNGSSQMVSVPWAEQRARFTKVFEDFIIRLTQECQTVSGAARMSKLTPDLIEGVMNRAVARGLARRQDQPLKHIGLDEKAVKKGHSYATVLSDIEGNRVLEVVEGRTQEAAEQALLKIPEATRESIEAAAMDMWVPYRTAVEKILPEAGVVYDKYHISAHLNKALDAVRRDEHRQRSSVGDYVLLDSKYTWLKTHDDLRRSSASELRALLSHDLKTGTAWALRTNFMRVWNFKSWSGAFNFLDNWLGLVRKSELQPMIKVADMIDKHGHGILNYIIHPITNAAAEGLNSTIQKLKHNARGLPNFQKFRTRVLFFLGKLSLSPA
jgi:transposase